MKQHRRITAILAALAAAALYAVSIPLSPFLLRQVPPVMLAGLLYLGAGVGMGLLGIIHPVPAQQRLTRSLLPYTVGMVVLDIAAPFCSCWGFLVLPPLMFPCWAASRSPPPP